LIFRVFTLFDVRAQYYCEPFFELTEQDAIDFVRGVLFTQFDGFENPFYERSDDFVLTEVGTYSVSTSSFSGFSEPRFLSPISSYLVCN